MKRASGPTACYFVQAAKELAGTGVTLMKMGQEGVPTVEEYLQANTKEGMTIGFDGRVVNEMLGVDTGKDTSGAFSLLSK